jgi:glycopeptide antibiotics resistance protein
MGYEDYNVAYCGSDSWENRKKTLMKTHNADFFSFLYIWCFCLMLCVLALEDVSILEKM